MVPLTNTKTQHSFLLLENASAIWFWSDAPPSYATVVLHAWIDIFENHAWSWKYTYTLMYFSLGVIEGPVQPRQELVVESATRDFFIRNSNPKKIKRVLNLHLLWSDLCNIESRICKMYVRTDSLTLPQFNAIWMHCEIQLHWISFLLLFQNKER